MSDSVVARVADRLEIQPEQTDRVLRTLAQLIKKQSAREGQVRVPGLGVFQQSSDALVFEPDETLAEAVNVRYASLETVPLTLSPKADIETPEADLEAPETVMEAPEADIEAPEADIEAPEAAIEDVAEDLEGETVEDAAVDEPAAVDEQATPFFEDAFVAEDDDVASFFEEEPDATDETAAEEEEAAAFFEEEPEAAAAFIEDEQEEPAEVGDTAEPLPLYAAASDPADFDDPDVSEAAAYGQGLETADEIDDETQTDLAPPGSTWSQEDLEALIEEAAEPGLTAHVGGFSEIDALTQDAEEVPEQAHEEAFEEGEDEEAFGEAEAALAGGGEDRPPQRTPHNEPRRRSVLPWIMLTIAVLIIGAALLYQFGVIGSTSSDPTTPPVATDTPPVVTPVPSVDETSTPPVDETPTPPVDETPTPPVDETPAVTPPPSGRIDRGAGGYTLVAASLPQSDAETEAARFRQLFSSQSIPVDVIRGESGGRIRYRVAIGQVPTVEAAQALLARLASDLPEGTWITRITPDS